MEKMYYCIIIIFTLIFIFAIIDKTKPLTEAEMENKQSRQTPSVFKQFLQTFKNKFSQRPKLNQTENFQSPPYLGFNDYQAWGGSIIPDPASSRIPSELRFHCKNDNYDEDDLGYESVCTVNTNNNNPYDVMARAIGYPRINKNVY